MITKKIVAEKLSGYLHHRISLAELVDWAENAVNDDQFDEKETPLLMEIVSRIGLADVKAYGLSWEDFESMLEKLGYHANIEVVVQK
ncbi:MAG: hypothetical protein WBW71_03575 [Bacteroidota bacterium]